MPPPEGGKPLPQAASAALCAGLGRAREKKAITTCAGLDAPAIYKTPTHILWLASHSAPAPSHNLLKKFPCKVCRLAAYHKGGGAVGVAVAFPLLFLDTPPAPVARSSAVRRCAVVIFAFIVSRGGP